MNGKRVRHQSNGIQEISTRRNVSESSDDDDIRVVYDSAQEIEKDQVIAGLKEQLEQKDARIRQVEMERDARIRQVEFERDARIQQVEFERDARIREVELERDAEIGVLMKSFGIMKGKIEAKNVQIQELESLRETEVGDLMKVIDALKEEVKSKNMQIASQTVLESKMYKVNESKEAVESENLELKGREAESLKAFENMVIKCKTFENISLDLDSHLFQRNAQVLELEKKLVDAGTILLFLLLVKS
ncbi:hypothetical protein GCK72_006988 [Caenorhabditis remanei]|uniref:Uncharacterized protein n=1 Tax=Caenorhabditis remanei TaxID=31234 RepID=A0A6A5HGA7_CAERE|nr:hypothetical protein GCK72_006988 [Caenorhabditis remanei]KAF1767030.1 hypothetical protein GCK72_006988 [Caenorhabditis remanei]